jgi:hypothetical protein
MKANNNKAGIACTDKANEVEPCPSGVEVSLS